MGWFKSDGWQEAILKAESWWNTFRTYLPGDDPPAKMDSAFPSLTWDLMEWCTQETQIDPAPLAKVLRLLGDYHKGKLQQGDLEPLGSEVEVIMHQLYWLGTQDASPSSNDDKAANSKPATPQKPNWNPDTGELVYGDVIAKRIKNIGTATNLKAILEAFQLEGWPSRIDDPLPGVSADPTRLRATIRSLNDGLTHIKFAADGSGEGIRWTTAE